MRMTEGTFKMVLHTIIGEYDILYAQERELRGFFPDKPSEVLSTDPTAYLSGTSLPCLTAQLGFPINLKNKKGENK